MDLKQETTTTVTKARFTGGLTFGFLLVLGGAAALVILFYVVIPVLGYIVDEIRYGNGGLRIPTFYEGRSVPNPNDRLPPNWDVIRR